MFLNAAREQIVERFGGFLGQASIYFRNEASSVKQYLLALKIKGVQKNFSTLSLFVFVSYDVRVSYCLGIVDFSFFTRTSDIPIFCLKR